MEHDNLPRLLSVDDLSAYLGVPVRTLDGWRAEGYGPPHIKLGRKVRYPEGALIAWVNSNTGQTDTE